MLRFKEIPLKYFCPLDHNLSWSQSQRLFGLLFVKLLVWILALLTIRLCKKERPVLVLLSHCASACELLPL